MLRRANGFYTYFAADIAYHRNKFAVRGFDKVINIWGADHHGHVARLKGAMDALGLDGTQASGHRAHAAGQARAGRRGGAYVQAHRQGHLALPTCSTRSRSTPAATSSTPSPIRQMDFDLGLAVREDSENPVYYVQYAHARICTPAARPWRRRAAPFPPRTRPTCTLLSGEHGAARSSRSLPASARRSRMAARDYDPEPHQPLSHASWPARSTASTPPAASRARRTTWRTPVCCSLLRPVRCSPTA